VNADYASILIRGHEKENLTGRATITASSERSPLFVLARGKTERVERSQIGDIAPHWMSHSTNGCMTEEIFAESLEHLRQHTRDGQDLHPLVDSYAAHRTDRVRQAAMQLNIRPYFIPPGAMRYLQILNRRVFGVLKTFAKHLFLWRVNQNPRRLRTKGDAVQDLVAVWENLTSTTVEAAWDIYRTPQEKQSIDGLHEMRKSILMRLATRLMAFRIVWFACHRHGLQLQFERLDEDWWPSELQLEVMPDRWHDLRLQFRGYDSD
jgi:hypothetical protein